MEWTGMALLLLVGVGIIGTGLPAAVVLVAVALFGASTGLGHRHRPDRASLGTAWAAHQHSGQ